MCEVEGGDEWECGSGYNSTSCLLLPDIENYKQHTTDYLQFTMKVSSSLFPTVTRLFVPSFLPSFLSSFVYSS